MCAHAFAAWGWYNYCASRVPVGKRVLRVNMDETAVCLFQGRSRRLQAAPKSAGANASAKAATKAAGPAPKAAPKAQVVSGMAVAPSAA